MALTMKAEERRVRSKGELRRLREEGKVPGVVYGKNIDEPTPIVVDEKELQSILKTHPNAVLEMEVPSAGKQPVMMTDVQRDALSRRLMHIDFHQINMNEEVRTQVPLHVTGDSVGVREGGILSVLLHELEVYCLPGEIPEQIEVDVSALQVGENLLVGDLNLPDRVETRVDAEQVVVTVLAPQKEAVDEEAEAAEAPAAEAAADEPAAEEAEAEAEEAK